MTVPQVDDRDWSVLTLGDRIRQIEVVRVPGPPGLTDSRGCKAPQSPDRDAGSGVPRGVGEARLCPDP